MTAPTAAPLPLPERDTLLARIREAFALMDSMIHCGENHSPISLATLQTAREAAAALAQRDEIPREPPFDDALSLAIMFHHTYERLAPSNGYDTRKETRIFDPESPNGKLMVATCQAILDAAPTGIPRDDARAITDIAAERERQKVIGWTPKHDDDEHYNLELAQAAGCYALHAGNCFAPGITPRNWPWDEDAWKPKDARRDLVRAGALIVAEIERLDRAALHETKTASLHED